MKYRSSCRSPRILGSTEVAVAVTRTQALAALWEPATPQAVKAQAIEGIRLRSCVYSSESPCLQCSKSAATVQRLALQPRASLSVRRMTTDCACAISTKYSFPSAIPCFFYQSVTCCAWQVRTGAARHHRSKALGAPATGEPSSSDRCQQHEANLRMFSLIFVLPSRHSPTSQLIAAFGDVIRSLKPAADTRSVIDKLSQVKPADRCPQSALAHTRAPCAGCGGCGCCRMAPCLAKFSF